MLVLLFIISIVICILWFVANINKSNNKVKLENKPQTRKHKTLTLKASHLTGLPLAENTSCTINYLRNKIQIVSGGNTFNIDINKISNIETATRKEVQKHFFTDFSTNSVFGDSKTEENFFIITYNSDNEIKHISFRYKLNILATAEKMVYRFKDSNKKIHNTIDL